MADPIDPRSITDPQLRRDYDIAQESSRLTREQARRLFQNRPQSWRYALGLVCTIHFTIVASRLLTDLTFHTPRATSSTKMTVLFGIATAVALGTRMTWNALFANPYTFMGYRRPGAQYRKAVYCVSFLTTVPAFLLHVWMIQVANRYRALSMIDLVQTTLAMGFLLVAMAMYRWMTQRFLLKRNDEHYEPTLPPVSVVDGGTYRDAEDVAAPVPRPPRLFSSTESQSQSRASPLLEAYAQQRTRRRLRNQTASEVHTAATTTTSGRRIQATSTTTENNPGTPSPDRDHSLHCQTIAWFDYMPESHLCDPIIPFVLLIYGSFMAWLALDLVHEKSLSKLSSPKAKASLYGPLGIFLLCAFVSKPFIRTTFFAHIVTPPPYPWVFTKSPLTHDRASLCNAEDGSTTQANADNDPRFRAPIKEPNYIAKYNESATGCDGYWGHKGRKHITNFRIRNVIYRYIFLGVAFFLFAWGIAAIFQYPSHTRDGELNRPDITPEDLERHNRIMSLTLKMGIAAFPVAIFILFYTIAWALRLMTLWHEAMARYAPAIEELEGQIQL